VRILSRYLLREFLGSSGAVLLALLLTWIAGDGLRRLDELGESWPAGLARIGLDALEVLPFAVPIACIAGAVWTLSRAVRHREIAAIRAGGIPLRRALLPLVAGSAALALVLGVFEDRILIPSRIALTEHLAASEGARERRPHLIADRYWYAGPSSVFSAGAYDRKARALRDVSVFRYSPERGFFERIDAAEAVNVERDIWEFRDARIREFSPRGAFGQRQALALRADLGLSGVDLEQARGPAHLLSLHRLVRALREFEGDLAERAPLQAALHTRLLQPLAVVILVLLAIPHAAGDVERGDSLPRALLLSIGWALAFWVSWLSATQLSQHMTALPAFAPLWTVSLGALGLGVWRYRQIVE
jgi:lipopolysaccharide export LptBFGC system permease protein LptF